MQDNIKSIFVDNIKLINLIDKAIYYFRIFEYDLALDIVADTADSISLVAQAIITNREYFSLVSTDSVAKMIEDILDAKKKEDYVLLADLFEMQFLSFICSIQELIMKKEDYLAFDEALYEDNIRRIKTKSQEMLRQINEDFQDDELERLCVNQGALMDEELDPIKLLDAGFFVEYSSCGLMTLGATDENGDKFYFHSNNKIGIEAFMIAKKWYQEDYLEYIIYGFGMGYHISELCELAKDSKIIIFESDIRILKLAAAFSDVGRLLSYENVKVVYDENLELFTKYCKLHKEEKDIKICIHRPSLRTLSIEKRDLLLSIAR